jgi:hypothetical protein
MNLMTTAESQVHLAVIRHVAEHGVAPDLGMLCDRLGWTDAATRDALMRLSEIRGIILKPGSVDVWAIHPFTLMPTPTWVSSGAHGWWANCAWCALGIGAALRHDIRVASRFGADGEVVQFDVCNGEATNPELLIHFPFRPAEWWRNPYNPCGCILFFSSESQVDSWCTRHSMPRGEIIDIATGIALAREWFGDYLEPTWSRKSAEEARRVFRSLGLSSSFWG